MRERNGVRLSRTLIEPLEGRVLLDGTPTPLPAWAAVTPTGSLIYQASADAAFAAAQESRTFTFAAVADQVLSVVVTPAQGLQARVEVSDSAMRQIATASAARAGQAAILQLVPIATAGTYSISVTAENGTGSFSVSALLNAAVEEERVHDIANDTIQTAQNLDGGFIALTGTADRAAVRGTGDAPQITPVFAATFTDSLDGFTIDNTGGGLWHLSTGRGEQAGHTATQSVYYGKNEGASGGGTYNTGARNRGLLTSPAFSLPAGMQASVTFNYVLQTERASSYDQAKLQVLAGGTWTTLASYNSSAESSTWKASTPVNLSAYAGQTVQLRWSFDTIDSYSNSYEGWYIDDVSVYAQVSTADCYSLSLDQGDRLAANVATAGTGTITMTLLNSSGATLATGGGSWTNVKQALDGFIAPATGTYYLRVLATPALEYTLTALRDAAFEFEANDTLSTANNITAASTVLGGLATSSQQDYFAFTLAAGEQLTLRTFTPGGGGAVNALNPALQLYSPSGTLLATDANGASDGRNARLTWTATTAGAHRVRVTSEGGTSGDYVLMRILGPENGSPGRPDLLAASDTGASSTDDATRQNHSLQFTLDWTVPGATVTLYAGELAIGSAVAAGSTTVITSDPSVILPDGEHIITARQTLPGQGPSPASDELRITIDTTGPAQPAKPDLQAASDTGISSSDDLTRSTQPTFTVSAGAAFFRFYVDGVRVGGEYQSGSSFTLPAALTEGVHEVALRTVDAAGNESSASDSLSVTIMLTAPAKPGPLDLDAASDTGVSDADNITADTTPTLSLPALPGYWRIYRSGVLASASYATGISFTASAANGSHTYTLVQVDTAGNESAPSDPLSVTIDSVAPAAPRIDLLASSDGGEFDNDNITDDATPTLDLGGTAFHRLYRNGVLITTLYEPGTSHTSQPLADGTYTYTAAAIDAAGNVSAISSPLAVTIDTLIVPAPDLLAGSDSGTSDNDNLTRWNNSVVEAALTFMVRGTAAGAAVRLYADHVLIGSVSSAGGDVLVMTDGVAALADGAHIITATQQLAAGIERAASARLSVTIDTVAPISPAVDLQTASDSGISDADNITSDATPTLTVTDAARYRLFGNGRQISADSHSGPFTTTTLSNGVHVFTAQAMDDAGNWSVLSAELQVTIDTVAPAQPPAPDLDAASDSGVSSADNLTNDTTPTFNISAGGNYYRVLSGVTRISGLYESAAGYTASTLTDGIKSFTVIAVDAAGNISPTSAALYMTIDTVAPQQPYAPDLEPSCDSGLSDTDNLTSSTTLTFSFGWSAPYIRFYDGPTMVVGPYRIGGFSISSPTEGVHRYAAAAVDEAGNESTHTPELVVTIDRTGPAAPPMPDMATASDSGISDTDNITNNRKPVIGVATSEAGRLFLRYNNLNAVGPVGTAAGAGVTSLQIGAGTMLFGPRNDYTVVNGSSCLTQTDVNGDGNLDLLAAVYAKGIAVLLGNANGTFQPAVFTPLTGAVFDYEDIVAEDFNSDGRIDVAVADKARSAVCIRLGNGDGTFQGELRSAVGASPWSLCAADFNADGIPDLASANEDAGTVSFLRGNGDGTFVSAASWSVGADPRDIVAADVNLDGKPDLVAVSNHTWPGTLVVIMNSSQPGSGGSFLAPRMTTLNSWLYAVIVGDFTGDGKPDVIAAGSVTHLLPGDGTGVFGSYQKLPMEPGTWITGMSAADLNHDGKLDLITSTAQNANGPWNGTMIHIGNGNGTFQDRLMIEGAGQAHSPVIADYNKDGELDAAFFGGNVVSVLRNMRNGLSEGSFIVAAWAEDAAGNRSTVGMPLYAIIVTSGPQLGPMLDLFPSSDSGPSDSDNITNDNTPKLATLVQSHYRVYRDGQLISDSYVSGSSSFTAPVQPDGTFIYTAVAVDAAGNTSPVGPGLTITIDTVAPQPTDLGISWGGQWASVWNTTRTLPWLNVNGIELAFSEDVAIAQQSLGVTGVSVPAYATSSFAYTPATRTARYTLASSPGPERLTLSLLPGVTDLAGNPVAGGTWKRTLEILPGDANGDGTVNSQDLVLIRNAMPPFSAGPSIYADIDGDGVVSLSDYNLARQRIGSALPPLPPVTAPLPSPEPQTRSSVWLDRGGRSVL